MRKHVNVENIVVSEQAEAAGTCGGFLLGATTGAKIGTSTFWCFGPVAAPIVLVSSVVFGGIVGAVGGSNLGGVIASKIND